ncbi:hypothetical protein GOA97_06190 [Sinorhizobium meliloti]|nr:hypothetical protein [Sinorhizobium meliloti]MDW9654091.1 hypothetical protein [Sinorhizobium meliloti]MDW9914505.1 hypothetical protein [Sinorhizobium meliloti]MDW9937971.1 hypothetical protein [Sinorhizobium meliloti]MDW9945704.1 hypothetical protein [Sinorhizobium meliloti]
MARGAFVFRSVLLLGLTGCVGATTAISPSANGVPYYLPKSLVEVAFTRGETPKVTATVIEVANQAHRYVLSYSASGSSDDNFCVKRTDTGLLSSVYFSGQDRSGDILLNIIQLLAESGAEFAPDVTKEIPPDTVTMLIDPSNPAEIQAFNREISPYHLSFGDIPVRSGFSCEPDSVCFATKVAVPIKLSKGNNLVSAQKVDIVDYSNYGSIRLDRAFLSVRVNKLDFNNGVLTSMRVRKDSELLAASTLPLRAIERLLAVPGNAIAAAFGTYEEKKAYAERKSTLPKVESDTRDATLLDIDKCVPS